MSSANKSSATSFMAMRLATSAKVQSRLHPLHAAGTMGVFLRASVSPSSPCELFSVPSVTLRQPPDIPDRVRLGGRLVAPVLLHTGESQRQAARIDAALLYLVEGNFDDQFRPDVDDDALARDLAGEQLFGLPREHLIGHALERLAQHDES